MRYVINFLPLAFLLAACGNENHTDPTSYEVHKQAADESYEQCVQYNTEYCCREYMDTYFRYLRFNVPNPKESARRDTQCLNYRRW